MGFSSRYSRNQHAIIFLASTLLADTSCGQKLVNWPPKGLRHQVSLHLRVERVPSRPNFVLLGARHLNRRCRVRRNLDRQMKALRILLPRR